MGWIKRTMEEIETISDDMWCGEFEDEEEFY